MAAVGGVFAEEGFGTKNQIKPGNFITINGEKYNIVAVLKKTGGGFGPNAFLDNGIFVVYEDGRKIFKDNLAEKEVNEIEVLVKEDADTKEVAEKITAELAAAHKVKTDEKDFSVIDPQSLQSSVSSILSLVTLFVGAIAGISLIVGGLSIANNMLTSVYERTKEIGILKAVGAKNSDILKIFVFEAGMVGGIGGLFGVILGYAIGLSTNLFGLPTSINPMIGIFGFLFAFIVGVISGYAPSKMAAKLPPIEALRYE
jgi:putative ABC transport system permease protein